MTRIMMYTYSLSHKWSRILFFFVARACDMKRAIGTNPCRTAASPVIFTTPDVTARRGGRAQRVHEPREGVLFHEVRPFVIVPPLKRPRKHLFASPPRPRGPEREREKERERCANGAA